MKKIMLAFMLCVLMITSVFAGSVDIGSGTTTSSYLPFYYLYDYSWSHFILPGDAITSSVDISKLDFNVSNAPTNYMNDNQIVYMKLTTASTITDLNYTVNPVANGFTEVYNGSTTWNGGGWQGINLTTLFTYDGTSNIEIIWENRDGSWTSGPTFYKTDATSAGVYKYADTNFPETTGSSAGFYPNTRVTWAEEGEPVAPTLVSPENLAAGLASDVSLVWTTGANTSHSVLHIAENSAFTGATVVDPAASPYVTDLEPGTTYYWKVVAVSENNLQVSSAIRSFTTALAEGNYVLELIDSYGDGWNGNTIDILVDGLVIYDDVTIAYGASESFVFSAEQGQTITTLFNASGSYPGENSFDLYDYQGTLLASGDQYTDINYFIPLPGSPDAPTLISPSSNILNVDTNVHLTWTTGANTDHAVLYIANNNAFTGATVVDPATSEYTTSLLNSTTYYWKVVAVGFTGIEVSSAVRYFTTKPAPIASFPWLEEFTTWPAQDWTQFSGILAETTPIATGTNWYHRAFGNIGSTSNSAYINVYGTKNHWLVTPSINLDANPEPLQLTFDVALSIYSGNTATALIAEDYVAVVVSTDDGLTWSNANILQEWTFGDPISHTGDSYALSLAEYSGVVKIGFYASRTTGYSPDAALFFDNIKVREEPAGAVVEISPATKDFGAFLQNAVIATPTVFTISNSGVEAATINEIAVANAAYFTITDTNVYPFTLEAGASITVGVTPKTTSIGTNNTFLRVKRVDPSNPFAPLQIDAPLTVNIVDSTGNDHNNPLILNVANQIVVNHTTAPYTSNYSYCTGPSVVYKLTLPTSKIMDISLSGTAWDTKMWVFNSFASINSGTATNNWYYNDDESSAGTGGGRFVEVDKTRDRALWSKMNPSFALAGDYYIVISGFSTNNGPFTMTINTAPIPAPALATSPFPATAALGQPSALTLAWTNAQYTETVDVYFGVAGVRDMALVQNNVPAINQYAVSGLATATTYEWKVINRNASGVAVDPATTWSFTTTADAPVAATYSAPANLATNVAKTGNLTWQATAGADGYYVYFSEDINFTGVSPVDQTTTSYAYSGDFATTYFWKVIPYNTVGQPTEGILTWSFTTVPSPFPNADLIFDGVRSVNQGMPMEPYYGYTMTQNIYQQAELNLEGSAITSISYLYNKNMAYSETVEIYMGHTTKNTFADGYDWQLAGFSHVFSGTMSVTTSEAVVTFTLDTPFAYNNTDNLVVAFFATQSGYQSNSAEFFNYPVVGNRSLTVYSDGTNYHTTFPSSVPSGTLKAFRPVSGFNYTALSADPEFTVSAETLTFADEEMGMVSSAQTLTISNLGLAPLGINSIVLAGTNANQFQVIDNNTYPATLATAGNMTVQVKYAPTTEGDHTATLEITDNQLRVVHTVQLLGSSIDNNVYATALPWSESFEGALSSWWTIMQATTTSATISINSAVANVQNGAKAIQFTNSSDTAANLQLISPTIVPDMDTYRLRFWMKGTAGSQMLLAKYDPQITTLTEVATFTVPLTYEQTIVEFTETTSGNERFVFKPLYSATYQYVYLDNVTFEAIPVLPLAELSVTTLDFGDVPLLETSDIATVSITNVGPGVLTITDVIIEGTDEASFTWEYAVEEPDMELATDESLDINVTFTPDTQGVKVATLIIYDDLGRTFRVNSATKTTNNNRAANNVALMGNGWVPPQGSTCADPLPLVFPAVNVAGYTGDYGDDYDNAWVTPSSYYLSGDDVVYQFTLANGAMLNGTITTTGTYMGAFILQDEPNAANPVPVTILKTGSGTTLTYTNEFIPAGTYYLIISTWATPQSIDYTINLTADPIPAPGAATSPSPATAAIDQPTALTLAWTNAANTETVDVWFGLPGGMTKVLNNVAVVNQHAVTGLLTNTVYNWKVINRNYTGETVDSLVTTWSFTTVGNAPAAVTYTAPANAATNVAPNGNLSWGAAVGAQGYRVYLSTDNTFTGVTPVEQTTRTYAYSGLDYSTTYYWKVLPYNVVGVPTEGVLVWSFTTIADPTVPMPISLNFEGTTTVPAVITLKNMSVAANVHGNIGNVLYKNVYSATSGAYAQFQSMNNITAGSVISFDYRVVGYNSPYAAWTLVAGYDYFVAKVSTDNGATFTTIDQINSTNHTNSNVMASRTIDISEYAGLSVIFRFEMNWPLVGDYYFDLDNIFFGVPPTAPIAALSATELNFGAININETSPKVVTIQNIGVGTLNITSIGIVGANAAEYSYTTVAGASMALANGQSLPITVVFAPISAGLKEATLQITDDLGRTFRVNTNSKNSNGNRNVNAVALTGNCIDPTIVSFPFTEGFEVGNTHASTNVSMWSQISVLGGGLWNINKTFTTYNRTPRTGEYNVTLQYSNTDWLIRPAQLVGGQAYDIELYARQDVTAGATIGIYYGTAANAASMTSITGQVAVINGDYQLVAGTFTPATSGIYYIGIKADLTSNPWHISVDDISIRESATELDIPTNVVLMTTGNGSTLTWDAVTSANSYIVYGCATPDGDYVELGRTATPYYVSYIEDGEMMKFFRVTASTEPAGTPAKGNRRN